MVTELASNAEYLVTIRLAGLVLPARVNEVQDASGRFVLRPGQGGVVLVPRLGDPANGWLADHLEPGASVGHPDPAIDRAIGVLSCVGNTAWVVDGPAAGARGLVVGKHGAVLVSFAPEATARLAPGERVAIEAVGVGFTLDEEPDIAFQSCSPLVARSLLAGRDREGRVRVRVRRALPPEAAGAGLGMRSDRFNIDLLVDEPPTMAANVVLRFGDVVALGDHDHTHGRRYRPGWVTVGVICHGSSVSGGHGLGMVSLITGPASRIRLVEDDAATIQSIAEASS